MLAAFIGGSPESISAVRLALGRRWPDHHVTKAPDLETGLDLLDRDRPDVVFVQPLDEGSLPALLRTVRAVRERTDIVLVAVRPGDAPEGFEELQAIDAGADEEVRLSVSAEELTARVAALLRRAHWSRQAPFEEAVTFGPLTVNAGTYQAFVEDRLLPLSARELRLLRLLVQYQGELVPRRVIELTLWGDHIGRAATLRKYIQLLRDKLDAASPAAPRIVNVRGVGYRLRGRGRS